MNETTNQQYSQHTIVPRVPSWVIVVGTLLVNIVIIWTPMVVMMTNKVAELEAVKTIAQRYVDDKIAQRVATLESGVTAATVISKQYIDDKVPARLIELELISKQMSTNLADYPHRISMAEVEVKRIDKDTTGLLPRVVALELDHKIVADDLKNLPNRMLTLEQTVERHGKIQDINVAKIETLEHSEWAHHEAKPETHNHYNGGGP